MKPEEFRKMALSLSGAVESAHMSHPDFRVGGKIFSSLGYPDDRWAMIALLPTDQQQLIAGAPSVFSPAAGAWGKRGSTLVDLSEAKPADVRRALKLAWQQRAPKSVGNSDDR